MPNYTTQYNPYLDLAGAAQGPASGLMRVLTELPQQRAQARLLGSQVDENMARIGLMGEQGRTEQAQQSMLRSQGQEYSARAGLYDSDAKKNELLMQLTDQIQKVVGQGSVDLLHGVDSQAARSVLSLNAAANTLNKTPNAMQQIAQGVNLMGAGGNQNALMQVQNGGRPVILPNGAATVNNFGTNGPAIGVTNPKSFAPPNSGSTASVEAAKIKAASQERIAVGREKLAVIARLEAAGASPDVIIKFMSTPMQASETNNPVALPPAGGTNAPVRIRSITPIP